MKIVNQSFEVLTDITVIDFITRQLEMAGRVCYKSENPVTTKESAAQFVERIINNGHESVLEHGIISIKFITDRGVGNELVRHRHCAFSQESTHYIDYNKKYGELTFVRPEGFYRGRELNDAKRELTVEQIGKIYNVFQLIENEYKTMKNIGQYFSRSILPLGLKTELVMTTNIREWRHILRIRTSYACHPQMRALMLKVLAWFKENIPIVVSDIELREL